MKSQNKEIYIIVKPLKGKAVSVANVCMSDTVANLKIKIEDKEGTPVAQQRLIFDGKLLQDSDTVAKYAIPTGAVMHLAIPI